MVSSHVSDTMLFCVITAVFTVHTKWSRFPKLGRDITQALPPEMRTRPTLSFSGCGVAYTFYMGVLDYVDETFDCSGVNYAVTSGSAWAIPPMLFGRRPKQWHDDGWGDCYKHYTKQRFSFFLQSNSYMRKILYDYLPDDAYKLCSNRLIVILTKWSWVECRFVQDVVYQYESNDDLVDALIGTCSFPGLFRHFQYHHGKVCWDGCGTNHLPVVGTVTTTHRLVGRRADVNTWNTFPIRDIVKIADAFEPFHTLWYEKGHAVAKTNHDVYVSNGMVPKCCPTPITSNTGWD